VPVTIHNGCLYVVPREFDAHWANAAHPSHLRPALPVDGAPALTEVPPNPTSPHEAHSPAHSPWSCARGVVWRRAVLDARSRTDAQPPHLPFAVAGEVSIGSVAPSPRRRRRHLLLGWVHCPPSSLPSLSPTLHVVSALTIPHGLSGACTGSSQQHDSFRLGMREGGGSLAPGVTGLHLPPLHGGQPVRSCAAQPHPVSAFPACAPLVHSCQLGTHTQSMTESGVPTR
jgi:hypothetical protein